MSDFTGFEVPYENYSKLPHEFIDQLPNISSLAELKCVLYVLRHTWGFSQFGIKVRLTTDEIANGRKLKDGTRIDNGTGLSEPSIRSGVEQAILHNFLDVEVDDSDRARIKKSYGVKVLRPEGKKFTPRGKKVYERTDKETNKRNSKKSMSPNGDARASQADMTALKDAIVAAFEWNADDIDDSMWKLIQKVAKALWKLGAQPGDVKLLHAYVKGRFSDLTPAALPKYYADWRKTQRATGNAKPYEFRDTTEDDERDYQLRKQRGETL